MRRKVCEEEKWRAYQKYLLSPGTLSGATRKVLGVRHVIKQLPPRVPRMRGELLAAVQPAIKDRAQLERVLISEDPHY